MACQTDVLHPRCHIQGKFGSLLCAVVYLLRVHILCSSQQHLLSFRDHHREEVGDVLVALANYPRFSIRKSGPLIHLCRPNSSAGWSPLALF